MVLFNTKMECAYLMLSAVILFIAFPAVKTHQLGVADSKCFIACGRTSQNVSMDIANEIEHVSRSFQNKAKLTTLVQYSKRFNLTSVDGSVHYYVNVQVIAKPAPPPPPRHFAVSAMCYITWVNWQLKAVYEKNILTPIKKLGDLKNGQHIALLTDMILSQSSLPSDLSFSADPTTNYQRVDKLFLSRGMKDQVDLKSMLKGGDLMIRIMLYRIYCYQVENLTENLTKHALSLRSISTHVQVLKWMQLSALGYGVNVTEIKERNPDGLAFCALLSKWTHFNYDATLHMTPKERLTHVFTFIETHLNIPQFWIVDDLMNGDVDVMLIRHYLAHVFYALPHDEDTLVALGMNLDLEKDKFIVYIQKEIEMNEQFYREVKPQLERTLVAEDRLASEKTFIAWNKKTLEISMTISNKITEIKCYYSRFELVQPAVEKLYNLWSSKFDVFNRNFQDSFDSMKSLVFMHYSSLLTSAQINTRTVTRWLKNNEVDVPKGFNSNMPFMMDGFFQCLDKSACDPYWRSVFDNVHSYATTHTLPGKEEKMKNLQTGSEEYMKVADDNCAKYKDLRNQTRYWNGQKAEELYKILLRPAEEFLEKSMTRKTLLCEKESLYEQSTKVFAYQTKIEFLLKDMEQLSSHKNVSGFYDDWMIRLPNILCKTKKHTEIIAKMEKDDMELTTKLRDFNGKLSKSTLITAELREEYRLFNVEIDKISADCEQHGYKELQANFVRTWTSVNQWWAILSKKTAPTTTTTTSTTTTTTTTMAPPKVHYPPFFPIDNQPPWPEFFNSNNRFEDVKVVIDEIHWINGIFYATVYRVPGAYVRLFKDGVVMNNKVTCKRINYQTCVAECPVNVEYNNYIQHEYTYEINNNSGCKYRGRLQPYTIPQRVPDHVLNYENQPLYPIMPQDHYAPDTIHIPDTGKYYYQDNLGYPAFQNEEFIADK